MHTSDGGVDGNAVPGRKSAYWCYYCGSEAKDEVALIQHQAAKHFACPYCDVGAFGRLCQSLPGLVSHVRRSHRKDLDKVPGALEDRQSVKVSVFGMSGIPAEFLENNVEAEPVDLEAPPAPPPAPAPPVPALPPAPAPAPPLPAVPQLPLLDNTFAALLANVTKPPLVAPTPPSAPPPPPPPPKSMSVNPLSLLANPAERDIISQAIGGAAASGRLDDCVTKALLAAAATNHAASMGDTARIIQAVLKAATASNAEAEPPPPPEPDYVEQFPPVPEEPPVEPMIPMAPEVPVALEIPAAPQVSAALGFQAALEFQPAPEFPVPAPPPPEAPANTALAVPAPPEEEPQPAKTSGALVLWEPSGDSEAQKAAEGASEAPQASSADAPQFPLGCKVRVKCLKIHKKLNGSIGIVLPAESRLPESVKVQLESGQDFTVRLANLEPLPEEPLKLTMGSARGRSRSRRGRRSRSRKASAGRSRSRRRSRWDPETPRVVETEMIDPSLLKPSMCMPYTEGLCKKSGDCPFAHSLRELQPGGFKPRLCPSFQQGLCPRGEVCMFAHSAKELPPNFKTVVCANFKQGFCRKQSICTFAHGDAELQFFQDLMGTPPPGVAPALGAVVGGSPAPVTLTEQLARALAGSSNASPIPAFKPLFKSLALPPGTRPALLAGLRTLTAPLPPGTPATASQPLLALLPAAGTQPPPPPPEAMGARSLPARPSANFGATTMATGTLGAIMAAGARPLLARTPVLTKVPALAMLAKAPVPLVQPAPPTTPPPPTTPAPSMLSKAPALAKAPVLSKAPVLGGSSRDGAPQKKGLCAQFTLGTCSLGAACAFEHNPNASTTIGNTGVKKPCAQWEMGGCSLGTACPFAHID